MDPDLFITIVFCAEVAIFALAGGLFMVHEWRRAVRAAAASK